MTEVLIIQKPVERCISFFLFLQCLCHIWKVIFHLTATMHVQALKFQDLSEKPMATIPFIRFSNQVFKKMQNEGSKHGSIMSMLKKVFGIYFNVFKVFADTVDNFIKPFFAITVQQEKGEAISLSPLYHFHTLHGQLDTSQAVTAGSSPLHIAGLALGNLSLTTKLRALSSNLSHCIEPELLMYCSNNCLFCNLFFCLFACLFVCSLARWT